MDELEVCLVEDDPACRETLQEWSSELGIHLHTLRSGQGLFDAAQDLADLVDCFLISESLPFGSTVDLIEAIQYEREEKIPLLVLSDRLNANLRDVSKNAGSFGWLSKPINQPELMRFLDAVRDYDLPDIEASKINFKVKLGVLDMYWDGDTLHFSGVMNENSGFDRLSYILPTEVTEVPVNWSNLQAVNIEGVKLWQKYVTSPVGENKTFRFRRCPPVLIEFHHVMASFFGPRVHIETVSFPNPLDLVSELDRESAFLADSQNYISMPLVARNILHSGLTTETPYDENEHQSMWFSPHGSEQKTFLERYLIFFSSIHRHTVGEFLLTREAILDQWSRLYARLSNHSLAMKLIWPDYPVKTYRREDVVGFILQKYDPTLRLLVAVQEFLHTLCLKLDNELIAETTGSIIAESVKKWPVDHIEQFIEALKAENVLEFEQQHKLDPSPETFQQLLIASFKCIKPCIENYQTHMERSGLEVFGELQDKADPMDLVGNTRKALENYDSSEISNRVLFAVEREALLLLSADPTLESVTNAACSVCEDGFTEMNSIILTLNSHDHLRQLLEHRVRELDVWTRDADHQELLSNMKTNAVTLLERQVMSHYFSELALSQNG